jgi:hypothetical protein
MDFIERLFGIAPDGGSGAFEFLLFLIPLIVTAAIWFARRMTRAWNAGCRFFPQ